MVRKFGKFVSEVRRFGAAIGGCRIKSTTLGFRYLELYRRRRFSPDEIHFFRLLDPRLTKSDLESVVSKEELLTVQHRLNPIAEHGLTEDKIRFQSHCEQHGIEVPRVFALIGPREQTSPTLTAQSLDSVPLILDMLPTDACVVKPVFGLHGKGVLRLVRRNGQWFDRATRAIDEEFLRAHFERYGYDTWLVQELVISHPALCELSKTDALQTIRVVSLIRSDGEVEIIAARLRLICGDVAYDNFNYGRTGNIIANLDPVRGAIVSVVGATGEDPQICYHDRHPKTGTPLIGFVVPQWEMARELALRAARVFLPLRTIGWDIAITPSGPMLIEGNVTWDTLSGERRMGEIFRYLNSEVAGSCHLRTITNYVRPPVGRAE